MTAPQALQSRSRIPARIRPDDEFFFLRISMIIIIQKMPLPGIPGPFRDPLQKSEASVPEEYAGGQLLSNFCPIYRIIIFLL